MQTSLASPCRTKKKRTLRWRRASTQRYPGQVYDSESGLNHNGFREMETGVGRYTQPDPLGLAGGISTYSYVGGNPLSRTDPSGLFWDEAGRYIVQPVVRVGLGVGSLAALGVTLFLTPTTMGAHPCEMPGGPPCFTGIAANDPEYKDGDGCPPDCRKLLMALNSMYHAIQKLASIPSVSSMYVSQEWRRFNKFREIYEKSCGKYNAPPSFDEIYGR